MEVPFVSFCVCFVDRYVLRACENLSVFIHIMMAKCKCSISGSIKSQYPFIKGVNENVECTLCNMKFCIAHGGRSNIVNHVKTKKNKLAVINKASNNSISNYLNMKNTVCAKIYSTETRASRTHFSTVYFGAYCISEMEK
jgi:hypothetical protein